MDIASYRVVARPKLYDEVVVGLFYNKVHIHFVPLSFMIRINSKDHCHLSVSLLFFFHSNVSEISQLVSLVVIIISLSIYTAKGILSALVFP